MKHTPFRWANHDWPSKEELIIHLDITQRSPLPWIHNQALMCSCCPWGKNLRRYDWSAWCPDGHHAVIWEHSSRLLDDSVYLTHFLDIRLPWYARHAGDYFLLLSFDEETARSSDRIAQRLLADEGQLLHKLCRDNRSLAATDIYRNLLQERLRILRPVLTTV